MMRRKMRTDLRDGVMGICGVHEGVHPSVHVGPVFDVFPCNTLSMGEQQQDQCLWGFPWVFRKIAGGVAWAYKTAALPTELLRQT